jgi:hypothetical protein
MRELFILVAHLLTTAAKLMRPGGVRAVVAESLMLNHQMLVLNRSRRRAPKPFVPCSHPFVERLIGTIRREHLDWVLLWSRGDLERKLGCFKDYYNRIRVHASLG